jgi:hypothetical protein
MKASGSGRDFNARAEPLHRVGATLASASEGYGVTIEREITHLKKLGIEAEAGFLAALNGLVVTRRIRTAVVHLSSEPRDGEQRTAYALIASHIARRVGEIMLEKDPTVAAKQLLSFNEFLDDVLRYVGDHCGYTKFGSSQIFHTWVPFLEQAKSDNPPNHPDLSCWFPSHFTDAHPFLRGLCISELVKLSQAGGTVVLVSTASSGSIEAGMICEFLSRRYGITAIVDPVFATQEGKVLMGDARPTEPCLVVPHDDQISNTGFSVAMAVKAALEKYPAGSIYRGGDKLWESYEKHVATQPCRNN